MSDRITELEHKLSLLESRLNVYGVPTEQWLSPEDAGKLLGCGRDKVIAEIKRAKKATERGEKPDLVYGTHYTDLATPNSKKSMWRVNLSKFAEVVTKTPPEQRPVYSWEM